jgi:hypothetical protein
METCSRTIGFVFLYIYTYIYIMLASGHCGTKILPLSLLSVVDPDPDFFLRILDPDFSYRIRKLITTVLVY